MFNSCGSQVAENLGDVFFRDCFTGFKFDDEHAFDEQVGEVVAKRRSIFVEYDDRYLLFNTNALLAKAMSEAVLVNFLQMTAAVILAEVKASLTNNVAEPHDVVRSFVSHFRAFVVETDIARGACDIGCD